MLLLAQDLGRHQHLQDNLSVKCGQEACPGPISPESVLLVKLGVDSDFNSQALASLVCRAVGVATIRLMTQFIRFTLCPRLSVFLAGLLF